MALDDAFAQIVVAAFGRPHSTCIQTVSTKRSTLGLICFMSLIFDRKLRQEVLKVTYFPIQMLRYFMIFGGARIQDPKAMWSFIQILEY